MTMHDLVLGAARGGCRAYSSQFSFRLSHILLLFTTENAKDTHSSNHQCDVFLDFSVIRQPQQGFDDS